MFKRHTLAIIISNMKNGPRLVADDAAVRSRKRLCLSVPVCLVLNKPEKVVLVDARFRDISDDGAAIFAGVEMAMDSEIQIEFTPPFHKGPLRVRAIVRNRRGYVYGIEFLPRDAEEEKILGVLKQALFPAGTESGGSADDRRWL